MPYIDKPGTPSYVSRETEALRRMAGYGAAVQVAFWLFLALLIDNHAHRHSDGMAWLAMYPATFILIAFVGPALILSVAGRWITAAAALAGAGLVLNVLLFAHMIQEFVR